MIQNYLYDPKEETNVDTTGDYVIKAFGAHYHEYNLTGGEWIIDLEKDRDLPNWAYRVFYMDGDTPVPLTSWRSADADTIIIYPDYDKAVLAVVAYEGTYDLSLDSPKSTPPPADITPSRRRNLTSRAMCSMTVSRPAHFPDRGRANGMIFQITPPRWFWLTRLRKVKPLCATSVSVWKPWTTEIFSLCRFRTILEPVRACAVTARFAGRSW